MKLTLSVIKADVGSIGGHIKPSQKLKDAVGDFVFENGIKKGAIIDHYVSSTGDDIAILMTHQKGVLNEAIHKLAWDAFLQGIKVGTEVGICGRSQDTSKDVFSGTVKNMSPRVAEPPRKVKKNGVNNKKNKAMDQSRKVLIIHGDNKLVRAKVKDFVKERLKLTPLILAEQPDRGLTIMEKFEYYVSKCCFAIVILTQDDITKDGHARAEGNAIYELGFFHGKHGRKNVVLLKEKGVRVPSELSGVVYNEFEHNKIEPCFEEIRLELENASILP